MEVLTDLGLAGPAVLLHAVAFVLLYLVLRKVLFGPVGSLLEERRRQIVTDRQEAEALRADMERRSGELQRRLDNIEAEARDRMHAAEREARAAREQLVDEARSEQKRIIENGLSELRREREKALADIRNLVADLAIVAASKVIEREMDVEAHRAMIDDLVEHGVEREPT